MSKPAIKTKQDVLQDKVFLTRSYDNYLQYGYMELLNIREDSMHVIGKISENLLQEDIIISYGDEFEKLKILEVIPDNFYFKTNMELKKIYISFPKETIKAHLFTNKEYVDRIYKYLICYDEEKKITLQITQKSRILSRNIRETQKKIVAVKKKFHPKEYFTKQYANMNIRNYLIYLLENYEVEALEEVELNDYMQNLRKYYDNLDNELYKHCLKEGVENYSFRFIYRNKTYKVTIGEKKSNEKFEDFGGFEKVFEEHLKNKK